MFIQFVEVSSSFLAGLCLNLNMLSSNLVELTRALTTIANQSAESGRPAKHQPFSRRLLVPVDLRRSHGDAVTICDRIQTQHSVPASRPSPSMAW